MKVKDIKKMIEGLDDNIEIWFIENYRDWDGIPAQKPSDKISGIVPKDSKPIRFCLGNPIYID